jgi:hypothetical protein
MKCKTKDGQQSRYTPQIEQVNKVHELSHLKVTFEKKECGMCNGTIGISSTKALCFFTINFFIKSFDLQLQANNNNSINY